MIVRCPSRVPNFDGRMKVMGNAVTFRDCGIPCFKYFRPLDEDVEWLAMCRECYAAITDDLESLELDHVVVITTPVVETRLSASYSEASEDEYVIHEVMRS